MDEVYNGYNDVDINANDMELEDNVTNEEESTEDVIISTEQEIPNTDSEELSSCPLSEEDPLATPMKEFEKLQQRAKDIEREGDDNREDSSIGKKYVQLGMVVKVQQIATILMDLIRADYEQ